MLHKEKNNFVFENYKSIKIKNVRHRKPQSMVSIKKEVDSGGDFGTGISKKD